MDEEMELEKVKFQARAKLEIQRKRPLRIQKIPAILERNYLSLRYQSFKEHFMIGQDFGRGNP